MTSTIIIEVKDITKLEITNNHVTIIVPFKNFVPISQVISLFNKPDTEIYQEIKLPNDQ